MLQFQTTQIPLNYKTIVLLQESYLSWLYLYLHLSFNQTKVVSHVSSATVSIYGSLMTSAISQTTFLGFLNPSASCYHFQAG